jgi:hypothetical protein
MHGTKNYMANPKLNLFTHPHQKVTLYQERLASYQLAEIHLPITCDDPAVAVGQALAHPLLQ